MAGDGAAGATTAASCLLVLRTFVESLTLPVASAGRDGGARFFENGHQHLEVLQKVGPRGRAHTHTHTHNKHTHTHTHTHTCAYLIAGSMWWVHVGIGCHRNRIVLVVQRDIERLDDRQCLVILHARERVAISVTSTSDGMSHLPTVIN